MDVTPDLPLMTDRSDFQPATLHHFRYLFLNQFYMQLQVIQTLNYPEIKLPCIIIQASLLGHH